KIQFAAPLAFGDSYQGLPIVGSTADFVTHLGSDRLQGRVFNTISEAVIGADVNLVVGDMFTPEHDMLRGIFVDQQALAEPAEEPNWVNDGEWDGDRHTAIHSTEITVVGVLPPTGTPWDRAIVTPVESVWSIHGLDTGHPPWRPEAIGPPFTSEFLPGVPAVVVKPESVSAAYGLRNQFRTDRTTAFFPAEIVVQLYALMGDARSMLSALTLMTQVLVLLGILAGFLALIQLFRRQFVVLRALGAPRRFLFTVLWGYASGLVLAGSVIGLGLGWAISAILATWLGQKTGIAMQARLGGPEFGAAGLFALLGCGMAIVPAAVLYCQSVTQEMSTLP
ncbi:MAG: FtsX-like permease family protein, partial [Cyanobacteria bacterium P01_F01_bin.42]